jgi:hypothetical protein
MRKHIFIATKRGAAEGTWGSGYPHTATTTASSGVPGSRKRRATLRPLTISAVGSPPGHGNVLHPHGQAALDLDGGVVGAAGECPQDSVFYHGLLNHLTPWPPLLKERGESIEMGDTPIPPAGSLLHLLGRRVAGGYPQTPTRGKSLWTPLDSRLRGND